MSQAAPVEHEPGLFALKLIDGSSGARNIALLRGWLKPGAMHAAHTHDVEEAVVFLSGRGIVSIDERQFTVGAGDAVLIPAGAVHSTSNIESETLHFVAAFADSIVRSRSVGGPRQAGPALRRRCASLWHRIRWVSRRMFSC